MAPVESDGPIPEIGQDDGSGFRRFLLTEYKLGRLTAEGVCSLAWHSVRAGARGVADLACDPKRQDQAKYLRQQIQARTKNSFYIARLPMWDKRNQSRKLEDFPMALPHESFPRELALDPAGFDPMIGREQGRLSPLYSQHEVVRTKGENACPVGYFSDAVPHTNRDSFFAFYWSSIVSGKRYLICSLRKQDLCQCGCRGYCTLHQAMRIIAWSFNCLASGIWPEVRHDGSAFVDDGTDRYILQGTHLADGKCGAMCEFRADLLEIIGAMGFAQPWSPGINRHPCFLCECEPGDLHEYPLRIEDGDDVFPPRDAAAYQRLLQQSVQEREIVDQDLLDKVISLLHFDSRKQGVGPGLLLREAVPELNLPRHARLIEAVI